MNTRAKVRTGAAMLLSSISAIGLQGVGAPAVASSPVVHVAGTQTLTGIGFVDLVAQGQQCLLLVDQAVSYDGDLRGTAQSVRPSEIRYFATCDELIAANFTGIPSTFSAEADFVGTAGQFEGDAATIRSVGRTDAAGNYHGIATLHGDLNGILHISASVAEAPTGRHEGILIVKD